MSMFRQASKEDSAPKYYYFVAQVLESILNFVNEGDMGIEDLMAQIRLSLMKPEIQIYAREEDARLDLARLIAQFMVKTLDEKEQKQLEELRLQAQGHGLSERDQAVLNRLETKQQFFRSGNTIVGGSNPMTINGQTGEKIPYVFVKIKVPASSLLSDEKKGLGFTKGTTVYRVRPEDILDYVSLNVFDTTYPLQSPKRAEFEEAYRENGLKSALEAHGKGFFRWRDDRHIKAIEDIQRYLADNEPNDAAKLDYFQKLLTALQPDEKDSHYAAMLRVIVDNLTTIVVERPAREQKPSTP